MSVEEIGAELVVASAATWQPTDYDIRKQALDFAVKSAGAVTHGKHIAANAETFYDFLTTPKGSIDTEWADGEWVDILGDLFWHPADQEKIRK